MVRIVGLLLATGLVLAGCAGVNSPAPVLPNFPGDNESVAGEVTNSSGLGVAVLDAGIEGLQCSESRLVLARPDASGYIAAREVLLPTTYAGRASLEAVELQPGTYHIVHYTCRNGANVTYAGESADGASIPWTGKSWPSSLASFTVGPGEVVDAGRLSLKRQASGLLQVGKKKKGKKGVAVAAIGTLSPEASTRLATERPELAGRMKPQAMVLAPGAAEVKISRCHLTADASEASGKKTRKKKSAIGGNMVSTSFAGPEKPMTACVAEGGKSDQFKAIVGGEDAVAEADEGASGQ